MSDGTTNDVFLHPPCNLYPGTPYTRDYSGPECVYFPFSLMPKGMGALPDAAELYLNGESEDGTPYMEVISDFDWLENHDEHVRNGDRDFPCPKTYPAPFNMHQNAGSIRKEQGPFRSIFKCGVDIFNRASWGKDIDAVMKGSQDENRTCIPLVTIVGIHPNVPARMHWKMDEEMRKYLPPVEKSRELWGTSMHTPVGALDEKGMVRAMCTDPKFSVDNQLNGHAFYRGDPELAPRTYTGDKSLGKENPIVFASNHHDFPCGFDDQLVSVVNVIVCNSTLYGPVSTAYNRVDKQGERKHPQNLFCSIVYPHHLGDVVRGWLKSVDFCPGGWHFGKAMGMYDYGELLAAYRLHVGPVVHMAANRMVGPRMCRWHLHRHFIKRYLISGTHEEMVEGLIGMSHRMKIPDIQLSAAVFGVVREMFQMAGEDPRKLLNLAGRGFHKRDKMEMGRSCP